MIPVPSEKRALLDFAGNIAETCRISVGQRSSYYQQLNAIAETGRYDGTKSLINMLNKHLMRTAAHLFSPVELKFDLDFENRYPKAITDRAAVVGNGITRHWERSNLDMLFGRGVFDSLKYGAVILKQWAEHQGDNAPPIYRRHLVMPWQFGVYREDLNDITQQPALCETVLMTMPEVWQRIHHMDGADKLYNRIKSHAGSGEMGSSPTSFFHQVLSTSQLQTGVNGGQMAPTPGGVLQLNADPNYSIMGPVIGAEVVKMHEIWVQDEEDYTTIQLIEPDILLTGKYKKSNLLIQGSKLQPYTLIQPNEVTNWFWGRSELVDLIEPQGFLSTLTDDMKRLIGLQVDKILGFSGETGVTDEIYAQFRQAGYINMGQGGKIEDLTPKLPGELLPTIKFVIEIINSLPGFPPIMQGQGESGVRAGVHASTLLKTASPTLRDRALLVERQCAIAADLTLSMKEAKEPDFKWTKGDTPQTVEESKFLLADLPDDWRVVVDSHSTSPIFADENEQRIIAGLKLGFLDGEYAIENMSYPNKTVAIARLKDKEAQKAQMMQKILADYPGVGEKILQKQALGGKR